MVISFLFFYFCFIAMGSLQAQQDRDSLKYYVRLLDRPQDKDAIISAYQYFEKWSWENLQIKDTVMAIYNLSRKAVAEYELGSGHDSESSATEALRLLDIFNDSILTKGYGLSLYNQLGKTYRLSDNFIEALASYEKALNLTKDSKEQAIIYNNIGNIYRDIETYSKAVDVLAKGYELALVGEDEEEISRVLDNLGAAQGKLFDPNGIVNMHEALRRRVKADDLKGMYASNKHLTEYYRDLNVLDSSKYYAKASLRIADQLNTPSYKKDALSNLIYLGEKGDWAIQLITLSDSLEKVRFKIDNKFAHAKYNLQKERVKTQKALLDSEREKGRTRLFQLLFGGLVVLSISLYYVLRSRYKRGKMRQVLSTESRISKKVHDEVANDVFQVMTRLQGSPSTEVEVIDDLESIYEKTRDISKENSAVDLDNDFGQVLTDLLSSYQSLEVNIITRNISKIGWKRISTLNKASIYRVLQELMTNMRKHSNASIVLLIFHQRGRKVNIIYKDNGVGCELVKNTGLQNAENRIKTLKGSIIFDSEPEKGFKVTIEL